jgi:hypothetical protein
MNPKFNKKAYEKCKEKLDKDTIDLYDTFNETIQEVKSRSTEKVDEDSITYSTSSGGLNDEHNGRVLNRARKAFRQLKDNNIISDYTETDLSDEEEHKVKFKVK